MDVSIKQHDTKGKFTDVLSVDNTPINLTACTVSFLLKKSGLAFKRVAVITDAVNGAVEYQPIPEDVATKGIFNQEWEVVFPPNGEILTFPNDGYNIVTIWADLG